MAMFARRVLQNMLDHLAVHLPPGACQKLAHGMNQQLKSALGFEWETALLFGFSHTGKIDYEAPSARGSRPDIAFVEDSESPIRFTADMTAVSDDGLDEENPAMRLFKSSVSVIPCHVIGDRRLSASCGQTGFRRAGAWHPHHHDGAADHADYHPAADADAADAADAAADDEIPRRIASSAETQWRILFRPVYSERAHSHAGAMQIFWFCMADFPILRLCGDFLDLWRAWRDSNSRPPDS